MSDDAFMKWCESSKRCTHCRQFFVGPVCECERKRWAEQARSER